MRRPVLVLLLLGLLAIIGWRFAVSWRPSPEDYAVQGVDVSEANGPIDWKLVAAHGADFGYAVATVGVARRDNAFETNWAGMSEAGLRRGAMHVYSLCASAEDQANLFNAVVPRDAAALPGAVIFAEEPGCAERPEREALLREIARFLQMTEAHLRKPLMVKVQRSMESEYDLTAALPRTIWAMGNVLAPAYAARPWRMWQASDFRQVDGIDGPVNWSVVRQ